MKTITKNIALLVCLSLIIGVFASCNKKSAPIDDNSDFIVVDGQKFDGSYVVKVGDYEISPALYRYYFLTAKENMQGESPNYWTENPDAVKTLKEKVISYIKTDCAVKTIAKENNITVPEQTIAEIDAKIAELKKSYQQSGGDYYEKMNEYHMTDNVYRQLSIEDALIGLIQQKLFSEGSEHFISDEKMIEIIKGDEYIRAASILISPDESGKDENKKKAQEALEKAKSGTDFFSLIAEYGQDPGMKDNSNGYYFKKGEMVKSYEDAAFGLGIDQISDVIESDYGYYIIKRLKKDEKFIKENITNMKNDYFAGVYAKIVSEKAEGLNVEYCDVYEKIGISEVK